MKKQGSSKLILYKDFLNELNKTDITNILKNYHIEYKRNQKKEVYIDLICDNINNIVKYTINLFQNEEYEYLKYIIKKKGQVTVKYNHLLLSYLKMFASLYLMKDNGENKFEMPLEIYDEYKKVVKSKKSKIIFNNNTKEYQLIYGFIDVYGVVDFEMFYADYSKIYKYKKEEALERINSLSEFYKDFNVYSDKKTTYIASSVITTLKQCKDIINIKGDYAVYTNAELINIHTFKYMESFKSYRKLYRFINRNYEIHKNSYKVINKYVILPYLINYQKDKEKAYKIVSKAIDEYFEFNNDKHKNEFIKLIENFVEDCPKWELKGNRR